MDGLGNQFLAGAAFAQQQHISARRGHAVDGFENLLHPVRLANDIFDLVLALELQPEVLFLRLESSALLLNLFI